MATRALRPAQPVQQQQRLAASAVASRRACSGWPRLAPVPACLRWRVGVVQLARERLFVAAGLAALDDSAIQRARQVKLKPGDPLLELLR